MAPAPRNLFVEFITELRGKGGIAAGRSVANQAVRGYARGEWKVNHPSDAVALIRAMAWYRMQHTGLLQRVLLPVIRPAVPHLYPQDVTQSLWALGSLKCTDRELHSHLADECVTPRVTSVISPRHILDAARGMAYLSVARPAFTEAVCRQLLADWDALDLSSEAVLGQVIDLLATLPHTDSMIDHDVAEGIGKHLTASTPLNLVAKALSVCAKRNHRLFLPSEALSSLYKSFEGLACQEMVYALEGLEGVHTAYPRLLRIAARHLESNTAAWETDLLISFATLLTRSQNHPKELLTLLREVVSRGHPPPSALLVLVRAAVSCRDGEFLLGALQWLLGRDPPYHDLPLRTSIPLVVALVKGCAVLELQCDPLMTKALLLLSISTDHLYPRHIKPVLTVLLVYDHLPCSPSLATKLVHSLRQDLLGRNVASALSNFKGETSGLEGDGASLRSRPPLPKPSPPVLAMVILVAEKYQLGPQGWALDECLRELKEACTWTPSLSKCLVVLLRTQAVHRSVLLDLLSTVKRVLPSLPGAHLRWVAWSLCCMRCEDTSLWAIVAQRAAKLARNRALRAVEAAVCLRSLGEVRCCERKAVEAIALCVVGKEATPHAIAQAMWAHSACMVRLPTGMLKSFTQPVVEQCFVNNVIDVAWAVARNLELFSDQGTALELQHANRVLSLCAARIHKEMPALPPASLGRVACTYAQHATMLDFHKLHHYLAPRLGELSPVVHALVFKAYCNVSCNKYSDVFLSRLTDNSPSASLSSC